MAASTKTVATIPLNPFSRQAMTLALLRWMNGLELSDTDALSLSYADHLNRQALRRELDCAGCLRGATL